MTLWGAGVSGTSREADSVREPFSGRRRHALACLVVVGGLAVMGARARRGLTPDRNSVDVGGHRGGVLGGVDARASRSVLPDSHDDQRHDHRQL
jgi:hypothetical protein